MAKWDHQIIPCYLENRVVREPCKRRSACTERGFKIELYIKLGHLPVLLASSGSQWSKSRNKEMKTREGDHVDGQLPQISIQLTRETQTSGHTCKSNI